MMMWLYLYCFLFLGCSMLMSCSGGGGIVQHHDLSLHSYSSSGDILQIRYANIAVMKSNPILCFQSKACRAKVLLAAHRRHSDLSLPCKHNQCIHRFAQKDLVAVITGYPADRIAAVQYLHRWIESYFNKYAEYPTAEMVASELGVWSVRGMYSSMQDEDRSLRPMAISAFFTPSQTSTLTEHAFFKVDNGGGVDLVQHGAIGDVPPAQWASIAAQFQAAERDLLSLEDKGDNKMMTLEEKKRKLLAMIEQVTESLPEDFEDVECALLFEDDQCFCAPVMPKDQLLGALAKQLT